MFIKNYGLFWQRDEVMWFPGQGKQFRLLGRLGAHLPKLQVTDFRYQRGIYILYGNYGAYYVGLTDKQGLGKRIKDHMQDHHDGNWDRFSWFGFNQVLRKKDDNGLSVLKDHDESLMKLGKSGTVIRDIEALLIKAIGGMNIQQTKFAKANEWKQIKRDELDKFLGKIS